MLHIPSNQSEDEQVVALASSFRALTENCTYRPIWGLEMPVGQRLGDGSGAGEVENRASGLTFANAVKLKNWVFALGRPLVGGGDWTVYGFNQTGRHGIYQFPANYQDAPGDNGTRRGQYFMMTLISKAIPILYPRSLEIKTDSAQQGDFTWKFCQL